MFKVWAEHEIQKKLLGWTSSKDTSQVWCKVVESLNSFSMEFFFCSGLPNTRSLGRGGRYQHQDNQMVSLVLLNNTNGTLQCTDLQIVDLVFICRLRSTSAVVTIASNNSGWRPVNVFTVIIPFRPAHILTRLWRSRRWRRFRGTQREYSSKPLKHRIVKRILVFKR